MDGVKRRLNPRAATKKGTEFTETTETEVTEGTGTEVTEGTETEVTE